MFRRADSVGHLAPILDHLERLPVPQRDALATVFGRSTGPGRELVAGGEKVRKRLDETRDQLTPQEEQIARLARGARIEPRRSD